MYTSLADAHLLAVGVRDGAEHLEHIQTVLCPPTIWLTELAHVIAPGFLPHLALGAQNVHPEAHGAFTGETSAMMVKEVAKFVILGHSERVRYFHEKPEFIAQKVERALINGLTPIVCIGEETQSSASGPLLAAEVVKLLDGVEPEQMKEVVVAYEPVWAIGSGTPATPEYMQQVLGALRGRLGEEVRLLYGGSVSAENAAGFLEQSDCDGLLIGGASLKLREFLTILQKANDLAAAAGVPSLHAHSH